MRALLVAAALGLATTAACAQAQDSTIARATVGDYQTRVFQLPAGSHPHDAAPGPAGQVGRAHV